MSSRRAAGSRTEVKRWSREKPSVWCAASASVMPALAKMARATSSRSRVSEWTFQPPNRSSPARVVFQSMSLSTEWATSWRIVHLIRLPLASTSDTPPMTWRSSVMPSALSCSLSTPS
ncbi:hypothetical protein BE20_10735 [Sorangium cellulosum]|nr:hypothetical protein BE20_10735 [Sorangium cellulosum]